MRRRPRLTVRVRLTLLYIGLFAVCGAVVVAVSYILVAQLGAPGLGQRPPSRSGIPASIGAQCRSEQHATHPNKLLIAQCIFQLLGAQQQRSLTLSHLLQYSLITVAAVMILAAVLGWIFSGRALRPVQLITAAARAASEHDLSARVALRGPHDELRELADTFDRMLTRLEATFESQQRFIANASHELRTPLAVMRATVDVVAGSPELTSDEVHRMAADIREAVDHAENLIGALLILARNERGLTVHEQVDLATVIEDVLDAVNMGDRHVHADLDPAPISGDPVLAERLVANLIDNAIRYNSPAGDVWIRTRLIAGSSQLVVVNTGRVINQADADAIFQPFQRLDARTSHDGYGLGLAIVRSIATVHNGSATAEPRSDGGLTITVTIPPSRGSPTTTDTQATEQPAAGNQS
ncbi:MAG TPA: HAMP domain-containing sensor histidine kinase [Solirubrobacteraceae bacterium]|nr:HAMP domain-containing sensor histidine kinase [Solirubrobacteraceae bacterium]